MFNNDFISVCARTLRWQHGWQISFAASDIVPDGHRFTVKKKVEEGEKPQHFRGRFCLILTGTFDDRAIFDELVKQGESMY